MLDIAFGTTTDPTVNNALDIIEGDLKTAVVTAIERLNSVLDGDPTDTRVVHGHLSDLHRLAAQIDQNTTKRRGAR